MEATGEVRDQFLTMLIRTQKSVHGWRGILKDLLSQIESSGTIKAEILVRKYRNAGTKKGKVAWVTYKEDKIVSDFIDKLARFKIHFKGTNKQAAEFVLRFSLAQLGHDWEQSILMIWEFLGNGRQLSLKSLNVEMKNFDYMKIFAF